MPAEEIDLERIDSSLAELDLKLNEISFNIRTSIRQLSPSHRSTPIYSKQVIALFKEKLDSVSYNKEAPEKSIILNISYDNFTNIVIVNAKGTTQDEPFVNRGYPINNGINPVYILGDKLHDLSKDNFLHLVKELFKEKLGLDIISHVITHENGTLAVDIDIDGGLGFYEG